MTIVGTAEILITGNSSGFAKDLEAQSAVPLGNLERDATAAGEQAGAAAAAGMKSEVAAGGDDIANALSGAVAPGAKAAGDEMEKGVEDGAQKAATAAEKGGADAGSKFSKAMGGGLSALSNLLGGVGLNLGPLNDGLDKSAQKLGQTSKSSGGLESGLVSLGRTTTLVGTVGFLAASAGALKLGTDFQKTTATMAANGNIPVNVANQISQAFLHSGNQVIFTAQQQAQAFGQVAAQLTQLPGFTLTAANATSFMKTSMDLAEESGENLGNATQSLAGLMQAFQVPAKGAAATATNLENASRLTGQSVDGLANTMERLKARMGVAAPSIADFSSLLIDLQDHGVKGSRGLMTLNSAVNTLLAPSDKLTAAQMAQQKAFEALPPTLQALAKQYQAGTLTSAQLASALKGGATATKASTSAFTEQITALKDQKAQLAVQAAAITGNTAADKASKQAIKEQTAEINAQITQLQGQASAQKSAGSAQATAAKQAGGLDMAQQQLWKTFTASAAATDKAGVSVTNLGLHVYDAQGQFVGMGSIIAQLQPKLKGLTEAQQVATLTTIFGKNASKSLLDTILAGPAAYAKAQKAVNDQAAAHHALVVQQQTLDHELQSVKVSVINMATSFGLKLIPVVHDMLRGFSDFLGFLEAHKPILIAFGVLLGAVLATAVAAYAYSVGVKAVNATKDMFTGIGKLLGVGKEQVANQEEQAATADAASASTDALTGSIQTATVAMQEATVAMQEMVAASGELAGGEAADAVGALGDAAADATEAVAEIPVEAGLLAIAAAELATLAPILLIIAGIAALGVGIYELVTHWKEVWDAIKKGAEDVYKFLDGVWQDIDKDVRAAWGAIENFFKKWWPEILGVFTGGLGLLIGLIIQHWSQISQFTEKLWHDVTGFFTNMFNDVKSTVTNGVNSVVGFFTAMPGRIISGLGNIASGIENVFTGIASWVYNNVIQPIINFFTQLPGQIGQAIGNIGSTVMNSITSAIPGGGVVKGLLHSIGGIFQEGGQVPGTGPKLIVAHGGEYVLTSDEVGKLQVPGGQKNLGIQQALSAFSGGSPSVASPGLSPATEASPAAIAAQAAAAANQRPVEINQTFYTPMSPSAVANEVGWTFRTAALSHAGV